MLTEGKRTKTEQWLERNWSMLMLSQDVMLLLYPMIDSLGYLVSDSSKQVCNFLLKFDDVTS